MVYSGGAKTIYTGSGSVAGDTWYLLSWKFGGSPRRLHVRINNGPWVTSDTDIGDIGAITGRLVIGSNYNSTTDFFDGDIADLAFYDADISDVDDALNLEYARARYALW